MTHFSTNIEEATKKNTSFRKVLFTGPKSQLVVMSILPGESIGTETHKATDQFIRIEEGECIALVDGEIVELEDDMAIVIPAGTVHNIINVSKDEPLKLYSIYSPPHHPDKTEHKTKADAMKDA